MFRMDGDHVSWFLVITLVTFALLLALVSSAGYGADQIAGQRTDSIAIIPTDQSARSWVAQQDRKEVRTASERWYVARELYREGRFAEATGEFERAAAGYLADPA